MYVPYYTLLYYYYYYYYYPHTTLLLLLLLLQACLVDSTQVLTWLGALGVLLALRACSQAGFLVLSRQVRYCTSTVVLSVYYTISTVLCYYVYTILLLLLYIYYTDLNYNVLTIYITTTLLLTLLLHYCRRSFNCRTTTSDWRDGSFYSVQPSLYALHCRQDREQSGSCYCDQTATRISV